MELNGQAVLIRIYIGETDRWHHQPLSTALVERLRREGASPAPPCCAASKGSAPGASSIRRSSCACRRIFRSSAR